MSISFSQFAFKKKPSLFVIESDSDDDNESVKYLGKIISPTKPSSNDASHILDIVSSDTENDTEEDFDTTMPDSTPSKKRKQIIGSESQDDEEDSYSPVKQVWKRKRVQVIDSDDSDDDNNSVSIVSESNNIAVPSLSQASNSDITSTERSQASNGDITSTVSTSQASISDITSTESTKPDDSIAPSDHEVSTTEPSEDDSWESRRSVFTDKVFNFINGAPTSELVAVDGMSEAKAEKIFSSRPFDDWDDFAEKYSLKNLSIYSFLENCHCLIKEKEKFDKTLDDCEEIAKKLQTQMFNLNCTSENLPIQPPSCLNKSLQLKDFQLIGLNWLVTLSQHNINGILADQMGLGKTVQTLAFIGHLLENGQRGPHLIVCPTSTLDNWAREIETWLPNVSYVEYKGSQSDRLYLGNEILYDPSQFGIIITTINLLSSTSQDKKLFRKLDIQYLVVDEAHMVKNMNSERYKHMLKLNVSSKLLLTGTPLQNNANELLALLSFLMPSVFDDTYGHMKSIFTKQNKEAGDSLYEKHQVSKLKKIMEPFVLRRLKSNVLNDLPKKVDYLKTCKMVDSQKDIYQSIINEYRSIKATSSDAAKMSYLMKLRKIANHPLLMRTFYTTEKLRDMAGKYTSNPLHSECNADLVFEDMEVMSDFELHTLCSEDGFMKEFLLDSKLICNSGKLNYLDELLPELKVKGDRILIFSQFVIMLNILEAYVKQKGYKYTRFDGSTKGTDRQAIIDKFNDDDSIFIFLLSTKAGGVGINLTSANTVILHDLDFNPYNDKQAEDRCHRVGQKREVSVYKLLCEGTVDEQIYKCGQMKLNLEKELVDTDDVTKDNCKMVFDLASKEW